MNETMYRYEAHGEVIVLYKLTVVRATRKGKWVKKIHDRERFVLNDATKRYAHETKADALESLRWRALRRVGILKANLGAAEIVANRLAGATPETVVLRPDHFEFIYED